MNQRDIDYFFENGFLILDFHQIIPELENFRKEIFSTYDIVARDKGYFPIQNDNDIIRLRGVDQPLQYQVVKHLQNASSLFRLSGNAEFVKILKSLGIRYPTQELPPNFRCDLPIANQSIFAQHQDYVYNIGSENSVTIWIPFQDVNEQTGALHVAPKTHTGIIYPNVNGVIPERFSFNFTSASVKFGQILIFNQKLVHQSGFNSSNQIRFSAQLRFTDIGCVDYSRRGYPLNHKVSTEVYLGNEYL